MSGLPGRSSKSGSLWKSGMSDFDYLVHLALFAAILTVLLFCGS